MRLGPRCPLPRFLLSSSASRKEDSARTDRLRDACMTWLQTHKQVLAPTPSLRPSTYWSCLPPAVSGLAMLLASLLPARCATGLDHGWLHDCPALCEWSITSLPSYITTTPESHHSLFACLTTIRHSLFACPLHPASCPAAASHHLDRRDGNTTQTHIGRCPSRVFPCLRKPIAYAALAAE